MFRKERETTRGSARSLAAQERLARDDNRLPESAELIHRPISEYSFAVNVFLADGAEVAAVIRHAAMISEHEVAAVGHYGVRIRSLVFVVLGNVIFVEQLTVDEDLAGVDADVVTS